MQEYLDFLDERYTVSRGVVKNKSTNRQASPAVVSQALMDAFGSCSRDTAQEAITAFINEASAAANRARDNFTAYQTPIDFINHVFTDCGFVMDNTGDNIKIVDQASGATLQSSRQFLETQIAKYMYAYNKSIPRIDGTPVAQSFLKDELMVEVDSYIEMKKIETIVNMREDLKFNPKVPIDKIIDDTLDMMMAKGDKEVNRTVFKHWLWALKRHIYNLPVKSELWLALYGGQNIGKNYFVNKVLAEPLKGRSVDTELQIVSNMTQEVGKFKNNFLINFDELAKGGGQTSDSNTKVDANFIAMLKAILTRDKIHYRIYHSQDQGILDKTFSCMSTANLHIYDVIDDPTGMRRFFEIELDHPDNTWFNKEMIDKLIRNNTLFYQGIDENNTEGYLLPQTEVWDKVVKIQSTYKGKSSVDYWLMDGAYEIHQPDDDIQDADNMKVSELYVDYKSFCKDSGMKPFNSPNFARAMSNRFNHKNHSGVKMYKTTFREE